MTQDRSLPGDDIVALVCLVMTGVALLSLGNFPAHAVELSFLGTPLTIQVTGRWLAAVLLILLTSAGMDALVRRISGQRHIDLRYSLSFWILPALVTLAAAGSVPRQFDSAGAWVGSLLFLGALLALVVVAECGTVDLEQPFFRSARLGLNIATYGAAMALYTSIYGLQERSLVSSTAIILITFPLALELMRSSEDALAEGWRYAAIIAVVVGQASWPLNALGLRALHGGALLMLLFYTLTGISQQARAERLNLRVLFEFVSLALVLAGLVGLSALRSSQSPIEVDWPAPPVNFEGQEGLPPNLLPGDSASSGAGMDEHSGSDAAPGMWPLSPGAPAPGDALAPGGEGDIPLAPESSDAAAPESSDAAAPESSDAAAPESSGATAPSAAGAASAEDTAPARPRDRLDKP
jgi:hypothetical protein